MGLPKNNKLLERTRNLRKDMTPHERKLWYEFLRYYPVKIYKQRIIANYIVDFYCHSAKLVIELDGSQHYIDENMAYDQERTNILESFGLKVIRFSNLDVTQNFDGVCQVIHQEIETRRLSP